MDLHFTVKSTIMSTITSTETYIMGYNFEKFTAVGGKFVVGITIAKPGGLSITTGFYSKYDILKYNSVDLFFDKKVMAIAIKFFENDQGGFRVKHREGGKGGYISAISFIKMYSLEEYFGKRFEPIVYKDENIGNVFVIKLN